MTQIISIQSQVFHGHVGNSAAVFPLQVKGIQVAAVPTVLLSNHPHYPTMFGQVLAPDLVKGLLRGIEDRGLIESSNVLITGYLGSVENAKIVAAFAERACARNPQLLYVCDPVMGDDDLGLFVKEELVDVFRNCIVPLAHLITPNQYELQLLSNQVARSIDNVVSAMGSVCSTGPDRIVVTGCVLEDTAPDIVETISHSTAGVSRIPAPRLSIRPCGTGDLFTALLVARLTAGQDLAQAAAGATGEVFAVLERTQEEGSSEMCLVCFPFSSNSHQESIL